MGLDIRTDTRPLAYIDPVQHTIKTENVIAFLKHGVCYIADERNILRSIKTLRSRLEPDFRIDYWITFFNLEVLTLQGSLSENE